MTDRDRLIELLLKCDKENDVLSCFHERPRKKQSAEIIADYLIANGVIVPPCKVEVVRCKDCRLATEDIMIDGWYYCYSDCIPHKPDDFCSYGERKYGK